MKKRIISLFLVIVMVVLTLTGCAYNFSKKDMSKYTEDLDYIKLLKEALADFDIKVTDEFVNDENIRTMKVMDAILAKLAAKADTTATKTEGTPGANDLVFYSYYITYTETDDNGNETTYLLSTAKMKVLAVSSMSKVQLGLLAPSSDLDEAIIGKLNGIVFGEGGYTAYKNLTGAGTEVKHGTVVYLSYEREYEVTTDEQEIAKKTDVFVSHRVVLDENNPFHAELIAKHTKSDTNKSPISVGSTVTGGITINPITEKVPVMVEKLDENGEVVKDENGNPVMVEKLDEKGEIVYETKVVDAREETVGSYTSLKIDFVEGSEEYTHVTDTTYDVSTKLDKSYYDGTNTSVEKQLDVKDKALTYHIFPAFYVAVDEYNADNVLNKVLGENITEATLLNLLFGKDYEDALKIEDETERNAKLDELKATYTFVNGEKELTIAELATELAAAQKAFTTADKALKTAKETYEKAKTAFEKEKGLFPGYEEALAKKLKDVEDKFELYKNATADLATAQQSLNDAKEAFKAYEAVDGPYTEAEAALTAAKNALTEAEKALTEAEKALAEAAEEDKEAAQAAVTKAQEAVTEAQAAVTEAQAELDDKKAAIEDFAAYEAAKKTLKDAEETHKAKGEIVGTAKTDLTNVVKAYNDAFTTYKTSYAKVVGTLNTADITEETAEDAKKITVSISLDTADDGAISVKYTTYELKEATGIGSLENEMNVAELTYRGNKSEAGKGGAVASQLKALDAREDLVECIYSALGATETGPNMEEGKKLFCEKYEYNVVYRTELEAAYHAAIELEVNKKVYQAIMDTVKVTSLPKRAVKNTYNEMLDTYKLYFSNNLKYDGTAGDENNSFYKQYNGSFQKYLTEHIMPNKFEMSGLSYKEALGHLETVAEKHVEDLVKIYLIADLLDVTVSDKEFEEYQESDEYQIQLLYAYYGIIEFSEEAARHAYQFDQIMNKLTKHEVVLDEDGKSSTIVYENEYVGKYNPLTEEEWDEKHSEKTETETEGEPDGSEKQ